MNKQTRKDQDEMQEQDRSEQRGPKGIAGGTPRAEDTVAKKNDQLTGRFQEDRNRPQ